MKFVSTWTSKPGNTKQIVDRFLAGEGTPPEGVKLIGRWHKIDGSGGLGLYETDNPTALYEQAAKWIDVLEIHTTAVVEDAEAAAVFAKVFKK
jgi:Protein of unknown function (DUF3303)